MIKLVVLIFFLGSSMTSNIIGSSYYRKRISTNSAGQRIIGGEDAVIEEYPFAVSIPSINVREFHIRAGSTYYYKNGTIYNVERILVHPAFNYHNYDFDVGLVKLNRKIVFDQFKQPIKLPGNNQEIKDGVKIIVVGWGATRNLGPYSENLQKSNLPKISNDVCTLTYGYQLTNRMFCIVSDNSKPCVGDSGSSAVVNNTLIGVASWSEACGFLYPTAYTNLTEIIDWIKENTEIS
ncbi:hypothetical protein M0802_011086 [Mischocyttarus mexicanus]|nr:hypothetical protein M0802_011086 [Mischocyttarus mexicanus]